MKRLVLMILVPFVLMAYDLPYDYIDDSAPKITKKNVKRIARKKAEIRKMQKESDGFFIGIGGTLGKPFEGNNREITIATAYGLNSVARLYGNYTATKIDGGVESLLGYKWFYGETFGMRYHFGYNARFLELVTSHNFTLVNWDILLNFVKIKNFKFGIILGFGYGLVYERINNEYCQYFKDCNILSETIQGNFGARFVLFDNYAIEILAQPRYSGKIFANMRDENSYNYGYYNNYGYNYGNNQYQKLGEFLSNKISEFAMIGTLRFVYAF
ncbi:hypothetical protein ACWIUD_08115 [Helicobacter sp. 23-1044]